MLTTHIDQVYIKILQHEKHDLAQLLHELVLFSFRAVTLLATPVRGYVP